MEAEDAGVAMKMIIVGNGQVGKTSLVTRFCRDTFSGVYKRTLGVDFLDRTLYVSAAKTEVTFHLWDTAGQEEYRSLTRRYFRGAQAAVLTFSITDRASFDSLHTWRALVLEECGEVPMAVVQNKNDLQDDRIPQVEVEAQVTHWELPLFVISVKEGQGVDSVFESLAVAVLTQKPSKPKESRHGTNSTGSSSTSSGKLQKRLATIERRKRVFAHCTLL